MGHNCPFQFWNNLIKNREITKYFNGILLCFPEQLLTFGLQEYFFLLKTMLG